MIYCPGKQEWETVVQEPSPCKATFARLISDARRLTVRSAGSVVWVLRQAM